MPTTNIKANNKARTNPLTHPGTYIIGGSDDIQLILDDQIVKIQSMHASPFVRPFKQAINAWEGTLQTLQVGACASRTVCATVPLCHVPFVVWQLVPIHRCDQHMLRDELLAPQPPVSLCLFIHVLPRRTCWTTGWPARPHGFTWSPSLALTTS